MKGIKEYTDFAGRWVFEYEHYILHAEDLDLFIRYGRRDCITTALHKVEFDETYDFCFEKEFDDGSARLVVRLTLNKKEPEHYDGNYIDCDMGV